MICIYRDEMPVEALPGRGIQKAVGRDSVVNSEKMTVGYARYDATYGQMEPHHHAEETVIIMDSCKGWVRYGNSPEELGPRVPLFKGTVLFFPELEWHVFEYDEGGFVDIAFIYGQVDNIRPEQIQK